VWILNYLLNDERLLSQVHFVLEARFCPRAIIISTHCSPEVPFRFYKKHIVTTDADKSFHDIRMHKDEPIYIQVNFRDANRNINYMKVLEDNPFIPDDYFLTKQDKKVVRDLLDHSIYTYQKKKITTLINQSLDAKNAETFMKYSHALRELEENFRDKK